MSLNWDVGHIKNFDNWGYYPSSTDNKMDGISKGDMVMNPITNQFIWHSMLIGIGQWVEKDINEIFYRTRSYEQAVGPLFVTPEAGVVDEWVKSGAVRFDTFDGSYTSLAEIKRHIGLRTNVVKETDAWWNKKLTQIMRRDIAEIVSESN